MMATITAIRLPLLMICGVCGLTAGIFAFPPLTAGDGAGRAAVAQAAFDAAYATDWAYCRETGGAMDCHCYARISGTVQATPGRHYPRARYIDRRELGRMQAADSC